MDIAPTTLDAVNFQTALKFTCSWKTEISQEDYDTYRKYRKLLPRTVKLLNSEELKDLFYNFYWYPTSSDLMCLPLAVAVFDTAVEYGVRTALTLLQKTLSCADTDGLFSPVVAETLQSKNTIDTAKEFIKNRIRYRFARLQKNSDEFKLLKVKLLRDSDLQAFIIEESLQCPDTKGYLAPEVLKQLRTHVNNATLEVNKITNIILASGQ